MILSEKTLMRISIFAVGILFFSLGSWAQVDATTALLLRPTSIESPKEAGLESGRYKVKRPKSLPGKRISGTEVDSESFVNKATTVVVPSTTTTTSSTTTSTAPTATTTTLKAAKTKNSEMEKILFSPPVEKKEEKPVEKSVEPVENKMVEVEEPPVTDQVRDIVLGHGEAVEAYKEQIHPDDIRLNQLEVDVLPGLISNSSKSSYSFRNYNTISPNMQVGAHLWMTPFLGVYGNYMTSMGADVIDDASTRSHVSVQHEWTEIGIDLRKFFGMSRKSNSLQFGIHLSEYKFLISGDSDYHMKLRSSGVGLHMLTRIPVAPSYSWIFGGKIIPRVQHAETSSNSSLSSGSSGDSTRLELMVGGELKMARQNQILWNLATSFEKNQFSGQALMADPETGSKPKGVSVENTFVIFSLGYRWGQ
jgi:hypothetical protein